MVTKLKGELWIIEPGANFGALLTSGTQFAQIYTRGPLPQALSIPACPTLDVTAALAGATLESLVEQITSKLAHGENLIYVSDVPAVIDVVNIALRRRTEFDLHVLTGREFAPQLPGGMELTGSLVLVDGASLKNSYYPSFSPSQIALVYPPFVAGEETTFLKMLLQAYGKEHSVYAKPLAAAANDWEKLTIIEIEAHKPAILLIPPRSPDSSLESFADVIAHLRAPNGCPWDRKQTHASLRTYLLEETYEALAALDENDMPGLKEELGDLMLQILLHAQIAVEQDDFNLSDILEAINRKIVYRHPHVFGEVTVRDDRDVLQNWEKLKEKERSENGKQEDQGILNGVPLVFPALAQAQSIQDRAARVGFDWADIAPVKAKVMEELDEVYSAPDAGHRAKELGDLLFAVVNLVRWYKVDAESMLRETNLKFRDRFAYIEKKAKEKGKNLSDMTLDEMDVLWEEAKQFDR